MDQTAATSDGERGKSQWQPLSALERRIVGVLVEKAKTTPSAYPLTLNAICTASSQKSNRYPVMQVDPEDAISALERLRHIGAVAEVQGGGRVPKYRHYLYEWLGVDKTEMAVMAELILRGAQTLGELRSRATRMEPIADLAALRPILQSLQEKKLVVSLTPAGRGQIVTHRLYHPNELERLRAKHSGDAATLPSHSASSDRTSQPAADLTAAQASTDVSQPLSTELGELREEIQQLREELNQLRSVVEDLQSVLR